MAQVKLYAPLDGVITGLPKGYCHLKSTDLSGRCVCGGQFDPGDRESCCAEDTQDDSDDFSKDADPCPGDLPGNINSICPESVDPHCRAWYAGSPVDVSSYVTEDGTVDDADKAKEIFCILKGDYKEAWAYIENINDPCNTEVWVYIYGSEDQPIGCVLYKHLQADTTILTGGWNKLNLKKVEGSPAKKSVKLGNVINPTICDSDLYPKWHVHMEVVGDPANCDVPCGTGKCICRGYFDWFGCWDKCKVKGVHLKSRKCCEEVTKGVELIYMWNYTLTQAAYSKPVAT